MEQVDVIVIGSGQGAVPLATKLARRGKEVVLFERGQFGGSCVNYGCYPSKAFLASAHAAGLIRRAGKLGLQAEVAVDFPAVMERVRAIVSSSSQNVEKRLQEAEVKVVNAEASFSGERTVSGGGMTVKAPLVVINTGNSPSIPPMQGIEATPYLTYLNFWELRELAPTTLIIGGGYIGLELGQGLARSGSQVHIIELMDRIAAGEEPQVSEVLAESLQQDGIQLHLGVQAEKVNYANGTFEVSLDNGQKLKGESLLVATGQKPNTEALKASEAGIELDEKGFVKVDEHFETSAPGIYAIGDVTGQPAFTHVSWEDHRRLLAVLEGDGRSQSDRVLGYAFFTDPQVGRVGLTLEQADEQGYNAQAVDLPLNKVARAFLSEQSRGFYRMVVDRETDEILGATLVGPQAGELIHVFISLMESGSTWQVLEKSVHIHPTFAEGLPSLARKLK